ncbi:hypothetical protein G3O00_03345 [Burkholderia sp. Ac-20384]|uniref:hypothetical protein n=1 Tax=Burkholderia sp. Ac-20384 TaxID=2703902 RepID=UPI00197FACD0|nr:hypothetical protein [Burkholderia sp. Ac-20384]MBN3822653.1 hypothetical protein [Burkholderia sp. Ac-20384]
MTTVTPIEFRFAVGVRGQKLLRCHVRQGESIRIDGSDHRWLEEQVPACTLLMDVEVDDPTSRLRCASLDLIYQTASDRV